MIGSLSKALGYAGSLAGDAVTGAVFGALGGNPIGGALFNVGGRIAGDTLASGLGALGVKNELVKGGARMAGYFAPDLIQGAMINNQYQQLTPGMVQEMRTPTVADYMRANQ